MITKGRFTTPDGGDLPYLLLGEGPRPMIYIPGAGDGIASADMLRERMAWWLKSRSKYFRILYVGRRLGLRTSHDVSAQARDIAALLEHLNWPTSLVEGQSAGGFLAQQLALLAPSRVGALALSSTAGWLDARAKSHLIEWLEMLDGEDWETFFSATANLFWTEHRVAMLRPFRQLLARLARPEEKDRLRIILQQLLLTDHRELLGHIEVPTLVTGGEEDEIFTPSLQQAMASMIPDARTIMQPDFGHGNDMENPAHISLLGAFGRLHIPRHEPLTSAALGATSSPLLTHS